VGKIHRFANFSDCIRTAIYPPRGWPAANSCEGVPLLKIRDSYAGRRHVLLRAWQTKDFKPFWRGKKLRFRFGFVTWVT